MFTYKDAIAFQINNRQNYKVLGHLSLSDRDLHIRIYTV